jgi:hypothetical protein
MMIDVSIMKSLIKYIGSRDSLNKYDWIEIIMNTTVERLGFSEFETYGTYVLTNFKERYKIRTLRNCRDGGKIQGRFFINNVIKKYADMYDTISFEPWMIPKFPYSVFYMLRKVFIYIYVRVINFTNKK